MVLFQQLTIQITFFFPFSISYIPNTSYWTCTSTSTCLRQNKKHGVPEELHALMSQELILKLQQGWSLQVTVAQVKYLSKWARGNIIYYSSWNFCGIPTGFGKFDFAYLFA